MNTKKVIIPIIISVATLILLTVGVTYAYFNIGGTNNFGTKTITTSAESIGNVALSTGTNLTLNLSAKQMMDKGSDLAYYASSTGTTTTPTTEKIGTATVTGEGIYNCTYKLTMNDNSSSMYDVFQGMSTKSAGQIILTVNGVNYDFNTSGLFSKEITGTMYGLTSDEARDITASLKIVNKTSVDQNALAGSNITITFSATSFECNAVEDRLPSTYQEVEYLKSTGTQYLITNVYPSHNSRVVIDYQYTEIKDGFLFGAREQVLKNAYAVNIGTSASKTLTSYGNTGNEQYGTPDLKRHVIDKNKNVFSVDGKVLLTQTTSTFYTKHYLEIFSANNNGTKGYLPLSAIVYSFKMYDKNTMIRNMVPCYRKSDNVRGMYDLVENKFYTNQGTGTFEIGSNV